MMKHEVRRCRRCKRKRLDDEPPEVMQYKTCAKCRIIERNKKNSRKPLAEETMLYGLKQFKEQSLTGNFMEEEGLLNDEFFRRFHNKPFNYEYEINEVLSNPNYVSPIVQPPAPVSNSNTSNSQQFTFKMASIPSQGFSSTPSSTLLQPSQYPPLDVRPSRPIQQQQQQHQQLQNHQPSYNSQRSQLLQNIHPKSSFSAPASKVTKPNDTSNYYKRKQYSNFHFSGDDSKEEDIFSELSRLGNKGEEVSGTSILSEEIDPYSYKNVYYDFQQFLLTILDKKKHNESISNLVYLKEFNEEFTTNLAKFDSTIGKSENNNSGIAMRFNEKQHRAHLLNNLKSLYIEPVIAVVGVDYNQVSSNLNDFRNSNSVKSFYHFSYDHDHPNFEVHEQLKKIKSSSVYFNYDRKHNVFIIKVNHQLYKPSSTKYSIEIRDKIKEIFKRLKFERSLPPPVGQYPPPHIYTGVIDYNLFTAKMVYDRLLSALDLFPSKVQEFLKKMNKDDFISDFINYNNVFVVDGQAEAAHEEEEGAEEVEHVIEGDEDDEEEDASDDGEEASEDELEDPSVLQSKGIMPLAQRTNVGNAEATNNSGPITGDSMEIDTEESAVPTPSGLPLGQVNHINALLGKKEVYDKGSTPEMLDPVFKPE